MPVYVYYCPKCAAKFEQLRQMSERDEPATCPKGHAGGSRMLSVFASVGRAADGGYETMATAGGGGCACGGGCGCRA